MDVDWVVLPVTVRDRQGRHVSDLEQSDFKVYEDRVLAITSGCSGTKMFR